MTERNAAQGFASSDPFELWRQLYEANEQAWTTAVKDLYDANERAWTAALRDVTTTQWFAEAQGKVLESFLALQKMMRDMMTNQLASLNLATRDDVARLGELIVGLEEKVDQLDDRLADVERQLARQERGGERAGKERAEVVAEATVPRAHGSSGAAKRSGLRRASASKTE